MTYYQILLGFDVEREKANLLPICSGARVTYFVKLFVWPPLFVYSRFIASK